MLTVLFSALVALGTITSVLLVTLRRSRNTISEHRSIAEFAVIAAVAWIISTLLYTLNDITRSNLAVSVGDALMVLAPGLVWVALRIVNLRNWTGMVAAVAAAASVCVLGLLIPLPPAAGVKLLAIAAFCIAIFFEARQTPLSTLSGAKTLAITAVVFTTLLGLRLVIEVFRGTEGADLFATRRITAAGTIVFVLVTVAMFRLLRTLAEPSLESARAVTPHVGSSAVVFSIENFPLVRISYGSNYARTAQNALFNAVEDHLAGAARASSYDDGRVIALIPRNTSDVCETDVRREFQRKIAANDKANGTYSEPLPLITERTELATAADVVTFVRRETATRYRRGK
ncbi:hypothetical protein FHX49_001037 [Microbacterium endophyticum]|uniref:Uncharacterized protein n=1 Tax=Microbacterium endophyticum TaxID=1526412 RepID=A0A7W4V281_9MICO|nr:hypothetical protein [Microbacterium endophyticum]MBB2975471.1 hypothetical protein [Microbacterium endophyticum]NIK35510.1 hypothetical protein [Microbacterium endophyticum]